MATKHIWRGVEIPPFPGFTFDSEAHKYALRGRPLKNITGYTGKLRDHSFVNPIDLEWGSHVHDYLYLHDIGKLLPGGDPRMMPYILGWTEKRQEMGWDTGKMLAEFPNCSEKYLIAGRFDRLFETEKWDWLVDVKTGQPDKVTGIQMAPYGLMAILRGLTTVGRLKLAEVCIDKTGHCKMQQFNYKVELNYFWMVYSLQNHLS
ncbi:MAG: PD-(D/E)XK nuclease family protein [Bacteroidetes bacterium]|nr:PD-(D/E)XK nuclease family protein [Bacteroidota bacterium]